MNNYKLFLESKGISEDIIKLNEIINKRILNNELTFKINFIGEILKLIDLEIIVNINQLKVSFFNPFYSKFENDILYDTIIQINILNLNSVKENLTHELTHILEYYNLRKNETKLNFNITPKYKVVQVSILNISYDNIWNDFKSLIYLSLDSEYNSRVSQLYDYLKDLNSLDKDYLLNKLLESDSYKQYEKLNNFNPELFLLKSEKILGLKTTIFELNRLNQIFIENKVNILDGYKFIKIVDENNIFNYLNKWNNIFKIKNKKHLNKLNRIIDKVLEDLRKPIDERFNTRLKNEIELLKKINN